MGYILGMCPQCNNVMSMPDDSAQVQCPTCNNVVMAKEAAALAGTADQLQTGTAAPQSASAEPAGSPYSAAATAAGQPGQAPGMPPVSPYSSAADYAPPPQAPINYGGQKALNGTWQTNTLFTVLGVVGAMVFNGLMGALGDSSAGGTIAGILSLAYLILSIVWAAKFYPSFFTAKPDIDNNELISFLNPFFGGIIFGLLWNHNMTLGNKGIAHIVFIVLIPATFVLALLLIMTVGLAAVAGA